MFQYQSLGLYHWAERFPDKIAVDDGRTSITYSGLTERVDRLAKGMTDYGVKKGDRVLISVPNFTEFVIILFACLKIGAVLVCVNLQFKDQELDYLGNLMGQPKLAFMTRPAQQNIIKGLFPELKVVSIQEGDTDLQSLDELSAADCENVESSFSLDNDMVVIFTSGSTGVPKAVELSVRNMFVTMRDLIDNFAADSNEVVFAPTPFCQRAGLSAILLSVMVGGSLVSCTRFDGLKALELVEKHRITFQFCVTTMYAREIDAYNNAERKPDISSLRTGTIGGSPVVKEYMLWFEEHAGCRLLNIYGMTECGCMIGGNYYDTKENRINKLGRPCSHATIAILDHDGNEVKQGLDGEICCKSQGVTKGYYRNPEMTKSLIDPNGWLHTGDIGFCDEDGYITLTGRKKEMVIRGGYNVFPAELENLFCKRKDVLYAAMVSYEGGDLGEKIAVFMQLTNTDIYDAQAMRDYAAAHLAKFKVPDRVIFISAMPLLPTGKIDKVKLKEYLKGIDD